MFGLGSLNKKNAADAAPKPADGFILWDGRNFIPVEMGRLTSVRAARGTRYRLFRKSADDADKPGDPIERVMAMREGEAAPDNLVLLLDKNTRLVVTEFFTVCGHGACGVELPGAGQAKIYIDGDRGSIATRSDGARLIYGHAPGADYATLVQSFVSYYDILGDAPERQRSIVEREESQSQSAPEEPQARARPAPSRSSGASDDRDDADTSEGGGSPFSGVGGALAVLAGIGAVGAGLGGGGGGGDGGGGASTVDDGGSSGGGGGTTNSGGSTNGGTVITPVPQFQISGTIIAGPLIAGHGLSISFYKADGSLLAGPVTVSSAGAFSVSIPATYGGLVIARLNDNSAGADYRDEASGAPLDIATDLRALFVIAAGSGNVAVTVSPLTELAARLAGANPTAQQAQAANAAVAEAFGLDGAIYDAATPVINAAGGANAAANHAGRVLAALSGMQALYGEAMAYDLLTESLADEDTDALTLLLAAGARAADTVQASALVLEKLGDVIAGLDGAADRLTTLDGAIAAMTPQQIAVAEAYFFAALAADTAASLSADQLAALPAASLRYFSIAALEIIDTAYLSRDQLSDLGSEQLLALYDMDAVSAPQAAINAVTLLRTPALSGDIGFPVAEGVIVGVYDNGARLGAATLMPDGRSWSFSPAALASGQHLISIVLEMPDGSLSEASDTLGFTVRLAAELSPTEIATLQVDEIASISPTDLAALAVPQLDAFTGAQVAAMSAGQLAALFGPVVTGAQAGDRLFSDGGLANSLLPTLSGTLRTGFPDTGDYTLNVYDAHGALLGAAAVSGASWSFTPSASLPSGTIGFSLGLVVGGGATFRSDTLFSLTLDVSVPNATGVSISSDAGAGDTILTTGDVVYLTVSFSEVVNLNGAGGLPTVQLRVGGVTRQATYVEGSGTTEFLFRYQIQAGDADGDGLSVPANGLLLNGVTIRDAAGNALSLTLAAHAANGDFQVDTQGPQPVVITLNGAGSGQGGTLIAGDALSVMISFSELVYVSGVPSITLNVGGQLRQAHYVSGSGSSLLSFSYSIAAGDADANGIAIPAEAISLNGGAIIDTAGNAANIANAAVGDSLNHVVDALVPTILSVGFTGGSGTALDINEEIFLTVAFSENVWVDVTYGDALIEIDVGGVRRAAYYVSGSGGTALTFAYMVQAGDRDVDGVAVPAGVIVLEGATITDGTGNAAELAFDAVPADASVIIEARPLEISSVGIVPAHEAVTYLYAGDVLTVQVVFTKIVTVSGSPAMRLDIGGATRLAEYSEGSGTTMLTFRYTLQSDDETAAGIEIPANGLLLNDGAVRDQNNHDVIVQHGAITDSFIRVDITQPIVATIAFAAQPDGSDAWLSAGDNVSLVVTMSEAVVVDGEPTLAILVGNETRQAHYVSGSGTAVLTFRYTIASGDLDADGISVAAGAIALAGGAVADAAGNVAVLAHGALAEDPDLLVDAIAPSISSVAFAQLNGNSGYLDIGAEIRVAIGFDEAVFVDLANGTPTLKIDVGGVQKMATYVSGSGTQSLIFAYAVATGDRDLDGIAIPSGSVSLAGAAIHDQAGNAAVLTHDGHAADTGIRVDARPPVVSGLSIQPRSSAPIYLETGDTLAVQVAFNKVMYVDGSAPTLKLMIGGVERIATYATGSGTAILTFDYVIQANDQTDTGVKVVANSLAAEAGTLHDVNNRDAVLTHSTANNTAIRIEAESLAPSSMESADNPVVGDPDAGGLPESHDDVDDGQADPLLIDTIDIAPAIAQTVEAFTAGDVIRFHVKLSDAVALDTGGGEPLLRFMMGDEMRAAHFAGRSGADSLDFIYIVMDGDNDADGLSFPADALVANGASLSGLAGGALQPGFAIEVTGESYRIDTLAPTIAHVAFSDAAGQPLTSAAAGELVQATISFSEDIVLHAGDALPDLLVQTGSTISVATLAALPNGRELVFQFTAGAAIAAGAMPQLSSVEMHQGWLGDLAGNGAVFNV